MSGFEFRWNCESGLFCYVLLRLNSISFACWLADGQHECDGNQQQRCVLPPPPRGGRREKCEPCSMGVNHSTLSIGRRDASGGDSGNKTFCSHACSKTVLSPQKRFLVCIIPRACCELSFLFLEGKHQSHKGIRRLLHFILCPKCSQVNALELADLCSSLEFSGAWTKYTTFVSGSALGNVVQGSFQALFESLSNR